MSALTNKIAEPGAKTEQKNGKVVITVEGGIVVSVHSSCPLMDVVIVDLDDMRDEACDHDYDVAEHRALLAQRDALHLVF